jgi:hypothetical protein
MRLPGADLRQADQALAILAWVSPGSSDPSFPGVAVIDNDGVRDAFFGGGIVRWFMDPDTRLQAGIAYVAGETDNGGDLGDTTIVEWGARYDTMIAGFSIRGDSIVFVGYPGAHFDKGGTDSAVFTHRFGTQSIQETDRYGATLDMPNFGRRVNAGQILE